MTKIGGERIGPITMVWLVFLVYVAWVVGKLFCAYAWAQETWREFRGK